MFRQLIIGGILLAFQIILNLLVKAFPVGIGPGVITIDTADAPADFRCVFLGDLRFFRIVE